MNNIFKILFANMLGLTSILHGQTAAENYIQTRTYLEPITSTNNTAKQINSVRYFDGLGKLKQIVDVKASPTGKDVVTHIEYDIAGRQLKDYLPLPQVGTQDGDIYPTPLGNATTIYGNEKIYSEKTLENSPLDRIKQQVKYGTVWASKPVKYEYGANIQEDYVRKYETTTTWDVTNKMFTSKVTLTQYFLPNTLFKNTIIDEDNNKTIEFKNSRGQLMLSRKVLNPTTNADTYYVYNEYDLLAYVVPPLASAPTVINSTVDNLYYHYRYDSQKRLVEKKVPGKSVEYIVYDKQDRIVATQDGNLKANNQWLVSKYDGFGRIAFTGLFTGGTRVQEQNKADGYGKNNVVRTSSVSFTREGMDVYYNHDNTYPNESWVKLLTIKYYDSYPPYTFNPPFPSSVIGQQVITDVANTSPNTKGLEVMNLTKNIENDNWTKNYTYYDNKEREIKTYSINHLNGYTVKESELDFSGIPKQLITKHKRLATDTEKIIVETVEYDIQNRLRKHWHKVDNKPVELLADNTYDELYRLKNKKTGTDLQSIDYYYNIRGWLTKINDPVSLGTKLFGYQIKYNNPEFLNIVPPRFGGDISEIDWKTAVDGNLKRYSYQYDGLRRLFRGIYSEPNATITQNAYYNEEVTYDINGNIKTLKRNSKPANGTTAEVIDDLVYNYPNNGLSNKLSKITLPVGVTNNPSGYNAQGNDIGYDLNGNITIMKDKGREKIEYNFLNLPNNFDGGGYDYVKYIYNAEGTKLHKTEWITFGNVTTETDYLDGFQYENGSLKFMSTAEGYYNFESNRYVYNYTDHLGNIRLSYSKKINGAGIDIINENNYYPFGLKHQNGNSALNYKPYKYQYNGKEYQDYAGMYDYGARFYMPDLGRWNSVDPLGELQHSYSPYSYVNNNPIGMIDPSGMVAVAGGGDPENEPQLDPNALGGDNNPHPIQEVVINGPKVNTSSISLNTNLANVVPPSFNSPAAGYVPKLEYRPTPYVPVCGYCNDGPVKMMGGAFDPWGIWEVLGMAISAQEDPNLTMAAVPLLLVTKNTDDALRILAVEKGAFSVADWANYPSAIPKPTGPFRILEGAEYEAARKAANKANQLIRKADPEAYKGLEIHEIHPVKYGGSATDPANKVAIPREYHRKEVTPWWNNNMRSIKKIP